MLNLWSKNLIFTASSKISTEPVTFNYTGSVQEYIVPKGCTKLQVDCVGGAGAKSIVWYTGTITLPSETDPSYCKGGRVECVLDVSNIPVLYVYAGGSCLNGFNSGTSLSNSVYGAGASDLRTSKDDLYSRLIVAGAGGNTGTGGATVYTAHGGAGGGLTGGSVPSSGVTTGATGGTQTSGGNGGRDAAGNGGNGGFGFGGSSKSYAGGAGWYGGGGGSSPNGWNYGGSAGGSSYTHPDLCSNVIHTQGYSKAISDGWIIVTPML